MDNSVLYTDWFLSEVITALSQRSWRSALIYASDHELICSMMKGNFSATGLALATT